MSIQTYVVRAPAITITTSFDPTTKRPIATRAHRGDKIKIDSDFPAVADLLHMGGIAPYDPEAATPKPLTVREVFKRLGSFDDSALIGSASEGSTS